MASELLRRAAFLVTFAVAAAAHAEPSAADKETARSLMDQGQDERDKGDLKAALKDFQSADAIMHVPTTGLEVARTEAALNQLVEARDVALAVTRIAVRPGEPAPFVEARAKAQALADELEQRIPSIVIQLHGVPEATTAVVTIDGVTIPAAAVGVPRKLNPGAHTIVARAGDAEGKTDVTVDEKQQRNVTVELATTTAATPSPRTPEEPETPSPKKNRTLAYVGFGVGVVGLAVGTVTGLMSMSKTSTLKDQCPDNRCPGVIYDSAQFQDDLGTAKTLGTVSTVAFVVGAAGVAVGIVGLVTGGSGSASASTTSASVRPFVGPGSAGVAGHF